MKLDNDYKIKITNRLLEEAVNTLNNNYKILKEYNSNLTTKAIELISLYQRYNNWSDTNKLIRELLLKEVYDIQVKVDPFLTKSIANDYLNQLLNDVENKYQHITLDIDRMFVFDDNREYNNMLGYIINYITFDKESMQYTIINKEQINNFYNNK